jgi:Rrf2 family iron-sulfur cluster assembly transcriptional regulator
MAEANDDLPETSAKPAGTPQPADFYRVAPVSQTVEYALRAMAIVALSGKGTSLTAAEISRQSEVPVHYLSKILRRLVAARLLISQKGHGGGFSLSRPAHEITFAHVLDAFDQLRTKGRCGFGWGHCRDDHPCPLHPAWQRLYDAFDSWASATTLADVKNPQEITKQPT